MPSPSVHVSVSRFADVSDSTFWRGSGPPPSMACDLPWVRSAEKVWASKASASLEDALGFVLLRQLAERQAARPVKLAATGRDRVAHCQVMARSSSGLR